jgi:hypothetical protein
MLRGPPIAANREISVPTERGNKLRVLHQLLDRVSWVNEPEALQQRGCTLVSHLKVMRSQLCLLMNHSGKKS